MKSESKKPRPKVEELKTIDPAVLEEILGGAVSSGGGKEGAVLPQAPFGAFYHS